MKIFFTLTFLFFFQNFSSKGSGILIPGTLSPLHVTCVNAFEWQFNCDFKKASIGFGMTGLGNEDKLEHLYNSDHLYYHPEIKNNALDFTSNKSWEFRISISIDIWKFIFKK